MTWETPPLNGKSWDDYRILFTGTVDNQMWIAADHGNESLSCAEIVKID